MGGSILQYTPLILSFAAIVVSVVAWHKSRVIYEIVTETDRNGPNKVNTLLKTGKYTILHVQSDPSNVLRTIYVLGKVKK